MSTTAAHKSFLRSLENFRHHIYAAYCDQNRTEVQLVLDHLKAHGLKVYDPAKERIPGRRIFDKWLANGIHKSRITLLFWSKEFRQDELCLYQSENAILRTSLTKGRHIVICVIINNCKIPQLYRQFDCVYAWRWREDPPKALDNVLQAVLDHLGKSRRTYNLGHRASYLVRKRAGGLLCQHNAKKASNCLLKGMAVLLNFRRIQTILDNCVLCCQNHGCAYRCTGDNIKQFYAHISACKFAHVQCMNIRCRQTIIRGNLQKHKRKCRYKKLKCPNEKCKEELTPAELKKHQELCPHRQKSCPYNKFGCKDVFELKDTEEHLRTCMYVLVQCDLCKTRVGRMDLEEHKLQRCPSGPAVCPHCNSTVKRMKLDTHEKKCCILVTCENEGCGAKMAQGLMQKHKLNCPWETYKCSYPGCSHSAPKDVLAKHAALCEYRQQRCEDCGGDIAVKDMSWHRKLCDQTLECPECGQAVPMSTKTTHDKWVCSKRSLKTFCRDCHTIISQRCIEDHRNSCQPVYTPEEGKPCSEADDASKPIGITRARANTDNQRFVLSPFEQCRTSASLPSACLQDSGFHSLSASDRQCTSPLSQFIKVAVESIPEVTTSVQNLPEKPKPRERSLSTGVQEMTDDWKCGTKIAPDSRRTLKIIDDLFFGRNIDTQQYMFARSQLKELTSRYKYHRSAATTTIHRW